MVALSKKRVGPLESFPGPGPAGDSFSCPPSLFFLVLVLSIKTSLGGGEESRSQQEWVITHEWDYLSLLGWSCQDYGVMGSNYYSSKPRLLWWFSNTLIWGVWGSRLFFISKNQLSYQLFYWNTIVVVAIFILNNNCY